MKYIVSQWEQAYLNYEYTVEADSPEQALERVAAAEYEDCEMTDIDNTGVLDDEHTDVRELAE